MNDNLVSMIHFSQGGLEFERTFVTFYLGCVPFYRSMETFLVNFLKVFSQDHHGKRLLSNHNANQWYMNTQPNALYLLCLLRCQIETTTKEMCIVQSCAESNNTMPRAKGENWRCCYHVAQKQTPFSHHLWICHVTCVCPSLITACQQIKHNYVSLNCI